MEIVNGIDYIQEVKQLIIDYTTALGRDLSFQNLDEELKDPRKKYTAPQGELFVAIEDNQVVGMVAYHKHNSSRCEMKRLYVDPKYRGQHIADTLVDTIVTAALMAGYTEMVLDTIEPLRPAIALYHKKGFVECEAYYNNPMDDVIYMKKILK